MLFISAKFARRHLTTAERAVITAQEIADATSRAPGRPAEVRQGQGLSAEAAGTPCASRAESVRNASARTLNGWQGKAEEE